MSNVYFFGAGATKAVAQNAPLNDEILETAFLKPGYDEIQIEIEEAKRFIKKIFYKSSKSFPRLEDVLSFVDFNLREKTVKIDDYDYDALLNIRNHFVRIIAWVLKKNLENLDSQATTEFVGKLSGEDTIISTNYDIILDNSLISKLQNTNYGVNIRSNIYPVEFGDGSTRAGAYHQHYLNYGAIKLLKLHGSLNWLYCPKCDEIDITLGIKGAAEYLTKEYELSCFNQYCTSHYEPLIVTPTRFKYYGNRFLKRIFEISSASISKANEIVFIGYSLPEADTEIRCLLLNGLNRAIKKCKITFVDRPEGHGHLDNYKRLFGKINYLPIGFIEYVNKMGLS